MIIRTVRSRIAVQYTFFSTAMLIILGFATYWVAVQHSIWEKDKLIKVECDQMLYTLEFTGYSVIVLYPEEWLKPEHQPGYYDPVYTEVSSMDGRIVLSTKNLVHTMLPDWVSLPDGFYDMELLGKKVRTYIKTTYSDGIKIGRINVTFTYNDIDHLKDEFIQLAVPVFLAGVIISLLTGVLISKKSLRPISYIADQIKLIGSGNLGTQLKPETEDEEIKYISDRINNLLIRINRSFVSIERFSSDASHELLTPVSIMKSEVESALDYAAGHEIREKLLSIRDEAQHMEDLALVLAQMASIESDTCILIQKPVWLNDVLFNIISLFTNRLEKSGVRFVTDNIQSIKCTGDENWLNILIRNLIDNAVKYGKDGGIIDISAKDSSPRASVIIRDYGPGVSPEDLEHLTDRFYRVEKYRSGVRGTGLGLSLCKWIVQKHHGELIIENAHPGLRVTVNLPG